MSYRKLVRNVRKLKMKVNRWEKYALAGKVCCTKKNGQPKTGRSRYKNWDTSGLKKHLQFLESLL